MKKILLGIGTLAATLAMPAAALAATYQYVNVNGQLVTETAPDEATALTQPTDIAAHSGVILIEDSSDTIPATTVANPNAGAM